MSPDESLLVAAHAGPSLDAPGNPRAGSRTAALARHVAMEIAGHVVGLDPRASSRSTWRLPSSPARTACRAARCDDRRDREPHTYKATYSGLLKTLLDAA
jgi:hypothetical protein